LSASIRLQMPWQAHPPYDHAASRSQIIPTLMTVGKRLWATSALAARMRCRASRQLSIACRAAGLA
ncbi:MAG: hypothetical protein AAB263_18215, partial [Planctomycetota bacterium]